MLVSERLYGLYCMMSCASFGWDYVSPLSRRMTALGVISEMKVLIEQLEKVNTKLDIELSVEDADIDFNKWFDDEFIDGIQPLFHSDSYIESKEDNSSINKMIDLFPVGKSTSFNESTVSSLKTGMRQLGSETSLNHADISKALIDGYGKISCLLREIKGKMSNISDELFENFCDDFFIRDMDLSYQEAERRYIEWKDEHEWKSVQVLEDKRTQEVLNVLIGGVISHSIPPTIREIRECPFKISEEALELNTQLPENIEVECARFAKYIIMKDRIMWIDYAKLGKYLYRHYKDLTFEEALSLKEFQVTLDLIHDDMAAIDPTLKVHLRYYEDNKLQAVLDNAVFIINTCKQYLNEKIPETFLEDYIKAAFYGDVKQELQKKLGSKSVYTQICKLLGMLKASGKVFKVDTFSETLASSLSTLTEKPNKDSMQRKIDEGASDLKSNIRIWTDAYIEKHCYTESERLFKRLSEK